MARSRFQLFLPFSLPAITISPSHRKDPLSKFTEWNKRIPHFFISQFHSFSFFLLPLLGVSHFQIPHGRRVTLAHHPIITVEILLTQDFILFFSPTQVLTRRK